MTYPSVARWVWAVSVALVLASFALQAHAQAYKYKDSRGRVHFTDNLYDIPERYRGQVETREMPVRVPEPGSKEEAQAAPPEGSVAASFQEGITQGMGTQSLSPEQQETLNGWMKRWAIPFGAAVLVNILIAMGLVIHAFTQGHVGWGLANFFLGVTTPVYLMMHVEQSLPARLGLLALYLSPGVIAGVAVVQLAGALA